MLAQRTGDSFRTAKVSDSRFAQENGFTMTDFRSKNVSPRVTRRRFINRSAALTATLASTLPPLSKQCHAADSSTPSPLYLPPFLSRPTTQSIFISALNSSRPSEALLEIRKKGTTTWDRPNPVVMAKPFAFLNWNIQKLSTSTHYQYRVLLRHTPKDQFIPAAEGAFTTQRTKPTAYTAVLITDPHTGTFAEATSPVKTLDTVIKNASLEGADFVLALGDNVAWNGSREHPQTDPNQAAYAYAMYRRHIGPLTQNCPHFGIIGNWAGESGKFPEENIRMVSEVRKAYLPNPNHQTYPQSGSEREDYYAFSWGGVLYVMLNIQTYSKPSKPDELDSLASDITRIEDWTLGDQQMEWLEKTLQEASEPFRFICMHHPAGGNAGDPHNTLYGRGGARAWNTGEQLKIHALMKKHQVQIFFYGHDHVFVDDVVDGIHYTLPGSCGAPWKFTKAETGYERFWPDSGHARLNVEPEKATVTFVNIEGKEIHQFSVLPS